MLWVDGFDCSPSQGWPRKGIVVVSGENGSQVLNNANSTPFLKNDFLDGTVMGDFCGSGCESCLGQFCASRNLEHFLLD